MSSEFGEFLMNNEKFDFENLKENLVGVALRGHPSRKPTEGLPYIALVKGGERGFGRINPWPSLNIECETNLVNRLLGRSMPLMFRWQEINSTLLDTFQFLLKR